jgi:hypothetical protein
MVKSRPEAEGRAISEDSGSPPRWVDSSKAMTGYVGWLVTECMERRVMLKRETCSAQGRSSLRLDRARRACRAGVRVPIVAKKQGNACGAKGCREMDVQ